MARFSSRRALRPNPAVEAPIFSFFGDLAEIAPKN